MIVAWWALCWLTSKLVLCVEVVWIEFDTCINPGGGALWLQQVIFVIVLLVVGGGAGLGAAFTLARSGGIVGVGCPPASVPAPVR
jgi:hypothetical protein